MLVALRGEVRFRWPTPMYMSHHVHVQSIFFIAHDAVTELHIPVMDIECVLVVVRDRTFLFAIIGEKLLRFRPQLES